MRNLIHKVVVGSRLHGLANGDSDFDYKGIFISPLIDILSPFKEQEIISKIEGKDDDTTFELRHFLKLAASGNPTILEVIWSNKIIETSDIGYDIVKNRQKFLDDVRIYNAHIGYSKNQFKKMNLLTFDETDQISVRTPKTICAYVRSLRQGAELLKTGEFNPVYEYPDRDFLLEVKYNFNKSLVPRVIDLMEEVQKEIDKAYSSLKTKRVADINWVENFILTSYTK